MCLRKCRGAVNPHLIDFYLVCSSS
jgi:hypothetical protein